MRPGWRAQAKLVAATATVTTAFWFAMAAWWYQHRLPSPDPVPIQSAGSPSIPKNTAALRGQLSDQEAALIIPVMGVRPEQLVDTFSQARGSGARSHDAIDIPAPRGTPVIAAAAGKVEKLFLSKDGGNTIYVRSPDGRRLYYYAHLDSYAPGLGEGAAVRQGSAIGAVGASGNADPAVPHLHFAVWTTSPDRKWWEDAVALNPYPMLTRQPTPDGTR